MVYYNYEIGKKLESIENLEKRKNEISNFSQNFGVFGLLNTAAFTHVLFRKSLPISGVAGLAGYFVFYNYFNRKMNKKLEFDLSNN